MDKIELKPIPGMRVTVAAHEHSFGPCFLAGSATVIENRDVFARAKGEFHLRFDSGVTGIFKDPEHLALLTELTD